jgi:hypothetical protein
LKGARYLGELGAIRRYSYWSDRRIRSIAADNVIDLDRRWRLGFKTPALGLLPLAELNEEHRAVQRHEVALRIERAIGQLAVEDFVTPPPASFAKGVTKVTFAVLPLWPKGSKSDRKAVILHTRVKSSNDCRVEICLFGSVENCADYLAGSTPEGPMWSSSSRVWVEQFAASYRRKPARPYSDAHEVFTGNRPRKPARIREESIVEDVLRNIYYHGMTDRYVFQCSASADWFAEVYYDVELDRHRFSYYPDGIRPKPVVVPVDRIVVGAALWVRYNGS